jgi:hypothetical protein
MVEAISRKRIVLICASAAGLGLLVVAVMFLLRLGAKVDDIGASRFGIRRIATVEGEELWAKREVRVQNFDVVAISKNLKVCESANPDTDLIFKYDANPLTVSKSGETLIVFWTGTFEQPKQAIPNVVVKQVKPSPSSEVGNPDKGDVQSINIPLEYGRHGTSECTRD